MSNLQIGRNLMVAAERKIQDATAGRTPGEAATFILQEYQLLRSPEERNALVAVLATHACIAKYRSGARQ